MDNAAGIRTAPAICSIAATMTANVGFAEVDAGLTDLQMAFPLIQPRLLKSNGRPFLLEEDSKSNEAKMLASDA